MSVQVSQVRAEHERHQGRRAGSISAPTSAAHPSAVSASARLRIYDGDAASPDGPARDLHIALGDLVRSASALDGAIAITQGPDLRIVASVRGLIPRRILSRDMSPAIWEVVSAGQPLWLADPATAGIHLPLHVQVLAAPFHAGEREAVALLSFHERPRFSRSDLAWLAHVLTKAAAPRTPSRESGTATVAA